VNGCSAAGDDCRVNTAAMVLEHLLPPGTALCYGVQFLCAAAVLGVGTTVNSYLARPRREHS
jgi:hypothetical protein